MPSKAHRFVQCVNCNNLFDKENKEIKLHPLQKNGYYCNRCLNNSLKGVNVLSKIRTLLETLEKLKVINTFSVQNKIMNANYEFTYVSFKINGLSKF